MFRGETMSGLLRKVPIALLLLLLAVGSARAQASYDLRSPNGRVELRIRTANGIRYDVLLGGRAILQDCVLLMDVEQEVGCGRESCETQREQPGPCSRAGGAAEICEDSRKL